jgi:hypothetical protein
MKFVRRIKRIVLYSRAIVIHTYFRNFIIAFNSHHYTLLRITPSEF